MVFLLDKNIIKRLEPIVINNFIVNQFKNTLNQYRVSQNVFLNQIRLIRNSFQVTMSFGNWNHPFKGINYTDKKTNFKIKAHLDDIWQCEY